MTVLASAWNPTPPLLLLLLLLLSPGLRGTPDCYFSHNPISSNFRNRIGQLSDYLLQDYPVRVASNLQDEEHCKALWSLLLAQRCMEQLKTVAGSEMQKLLETVNTEIHFVTLCAFQPLPSCLRFVQTNISHLLQDTSEQLIYLKPRITHQNFSRCLEVQCQPGNSFCTASASPLQPPALLACSTGWAWSLFLPRLLHSAASEESWSPGGHSAASPSILNAPGPAAVARCLPAAGHHLVLSMAEEEEEEEEKEEDA